MCPAFGSLARVVVLTIDLEICIVRIGCPIVRYVGIIGADFADSDRTKRGYLPCRWLPRNAEAHLIKGKETYPSIWGRIFMIEADLTGDPIGMAFFDRCAEVFKDSTSVVSCTPHIKKTTRLAISPQ